MEVSATRSVLRYPDVIGIGAQKAGTTWAYEQMKAHPQIFVPETKELNFFYSDRPDTWYAEQFQDAPENRVAGEVSPNYFVRKEIPKRMHDLVPAAKLFCILRNPTERAFSQWKMARQLGNMPMELSFFDAFRQNRNWISEQGEYLKLIEQFETYYPVEKQFLVLFFDDIKSNPDQLVHTLYDFLGVDPKFKPPEIKTVVGGATDSSVMLEKDRLEVHSFYEESVKLLGERFSRDLTHWTDGN